MAYRGPCGLSVEDQRLEHHKHLRLQRRSAIHTDIRRPNPHVDGTRGCVWCFGTRVQQLRHAHMHGHTGCGSCAWRTRRLPWGTTTCAPGKQCCSGSNTCIPFVVVASSFIVSSLRPGQCTFGPSDFTTVEFSHYRKFHNVRIPLACK